MTRLRRAVLIVATPGVVVLAAGAASLGWAEYQERQARRAVRVVERVMAQRQYDANIKAIEDEIAKPWRFAVGLSTTSNPVTATWHPEVPR